MATIDELNFKLILDNKEFNSRIKHDIRQAQNLNIQLSKLLEVKKHATYVYQSDVENARKALQMEKDRVKANELIKREKEKTNREHEKTIGLKNKLKAQIDAINNGYNSQSRILSELKNLALGYLSIQGASQFLSSLIRVTGEFEMQKTTLSAMLGDMNQAEQVLTRIKGLAVESPFEFKELATYTKQLSAFSIPVEELYDTTKMLADISAGLGVGMDRIILAYGQVRSAAFLRGQEVRQFTEAGIPILDELAKQFSELEGRAVSAGEVFDKISARLVPFEMVAKVFKDMTSEGGKFYNMQEIQAETLQGKISNLRDAYEMMLNEIGEANSGILKGGVDALRGLMQNWEKIGQQLVMIIELFGIYKTSVALLNISDTIAKFGGLTKALKQTAVAQKLLNSALLTNPYIAAATAISAFTIALVKAIKASKEFKNEINGIVQIQYGEANEAVERYNKLTSELQNATVGSYNYREAISKLNSEYGEYLPELLNEKNALDLIKTSSDAVTQSIYNRAKAIAYERAQQKTEDTYGEWRDYYKAEFIRKLQDDGIVEQAAKDLWEQFNEAIKHQAAGWNPADVFNEVYKSYFNTSENYFKGFTGVLNNIKQSTLFIRNIYDVNTTGWMTARDALWNYSLVLNDINEAEQLNNDILDSKWGKGYDLAEERKKIEELNKWYKTEETIIRDLNLEQGQYNDKIEALNIEKLRQLVQIYTDLGRTEIAANYQKQLDSLTKIPEGWRGKVQNVLKGLGLTKGTSFGLWADDTTNSAAYVDNMIKRYNELNKQMKYISSFDTEGVERIKKEMEMIEAVAKELKIDMAELSSVKKGTKSPEQTAIESRIDALKKLHDLYKRFKKLGAPDDVLADAFKGYFPDLVKTYGEDFITQQNYLERAIEAARELEKYDKEAGQKILTSLGGDAASKDIEKWTKIYNTIQDASDAAKRYFETLRKWSAEDFTIGGEGVTFDMGKIASDLRQSLNEIDLREQRARELFNKINSSDETAMATIKEDFEKEFGTGSWDKFYQEFLVKGDQAFKELAEKQKNYEKKLAQESLNDIARKYLKEVYKDDSIDLSEFGDKSLSQVKAMRKKLQDLLAKSPVIIPVEIQNALKNAEGYNAETGSIADVDLTKFLADMRASGVSVSEEEEAMLRLIQVLNALGLSFEKFGETVKGVMADDISEVSQEEAKKTMSAIRSLSSQVASLGETFAKLGEATDNDMLKGFGKGLSSFKEFADILTECEALTDFIGVSIEKAAYEAEGMTEEAKKAGEELKNIGKSSDWITLIIKIAMLGISKIVDGITGAAEATRQAKEEALEYAHALDEIEFEDRMAHFDTIFGTDGFGKYRQALKEAEGYLDKIRASAKEIDYSYKDFGKDIKYGGTKNGLKDLYKDTFGSLDSSGKFAVDKRTGWQKFWGTGDDLYQVYNVSDFFDGEGKLMTDKLQAFYDSNKDALDDSTRQSIENMLYYGEQYEKAMQEIDDYVSSIFEQLASDIADSMINSFLEMGDAAGGLEDVFENLGQTMTKSLLESFILDTVLKKYQDKAKELYKTSGGLTDQQFWDEMSGLFVDMKDELKGAAPYLNEVFEHLQSIDMMPESGEGEGNSLGEGIKNITEDTANLLASYLNAIRADVSYAKTLWMRMDANTQRIAGLLVGLSVPNLMEYQAQIAANTYDTAVYTKSILNELLDVFTYEGGSKAVRVYS